MASCGEHGPDELEEWELEDIFGVEAEDWLEWEEGIDE